MKIVALAGGVGGAKLADGLYRSLPPEDLTIIVNTGDDFDHFGLRICPDLDTVCYTLAERANPQTGWGQVDETWQALDAIRELGGPDWFHLGDKDLGLHLERTRLLREGNNLTTVTGRICRAWGIRSAVLPMTDAPMATMVQTVEGDELPFQEYFVHQQCQPQVSGFRFQGIEDATISPQVENALRSAEGIIICPSNPWVSIGPILAVRGVQELIADLPIVAVSPIIGGKAIKGPAAKMYRELGFEPSAFAVAQQYHDFLSGFVLDEIDAELTDLIRQSGIIPLVARTIMNSIADRRRLAEEVLDFCEELSRRQISQ